MAKAKPKDRKLSKGDTTVIMSPPKAKLLERPLREYGYWTGSGKPNRPNALILFSGRSRAGDIQEFLDGYGWNVCAIDILSPKPTDILDDAVWTSVLKDIKEGLYAGLWVATPCNTFSPLREKQPGPRVLGTKEHIQGLPKSQLTQAEQKQVKESNIMVDRSAKACQARKSGSPHHLVDAGHSRACAAGGDGAGRV